MDASSIQGELLIAGPAERTETLAAAEGSAAREDTASRASIRSARSAAPADPDQPLLLSFDDLASFTYVPDDRPVQDGAREVELDGSPSGGTLEEPPLVDQIPADIHALSGRLVTVEGYLDPYTIQSGSLSSFLLTRHPSGCCFGTFGSMNEWIEVELPERGTGQFAPYSQVEVTGVLSVGEERDEFGYVLSIYRMQAGEVLEIDW